LQEYVGSILELLRGLKDREQQRAVLNADDEHFAAAAAAASGVPCVTYGINNATADVRAESIELTLWQTTVRLAAARHQSILRTQSRPTLSWCTTPCSLVVIQMLLLFARSASRLLVLCCSRIVSLPYTKGCHPLASAQTNQPRPDTFCTTVSKPQMIVSTPKGKLEIITNLVGRHNVYNVLAAVAVGLLLGLDLADIGAGVEAVQVIPGRCEVVNNVLDLPLEGEDAEGLQQQPNLPRDFPVVVDAADTPQRLAAVLDALREAGADRIFTVFGCDGVVSGVPGTSSNCL
jgi:UDP-N-acetylmuramyl tripeptide synthase